MQELAENSRWLNGTAKTRARGSLTQLGEIIRHAVCHAGRVLKGVPARRIPVGIRADLGDRTHRTVAEAELDDRRVTAAEVVPVGRVLQLPIGRQAARTKPRQREIA